MVLILGFETIWDNLVGFCMVLLHCGFEPIDAFDLISKKRGVAVPDTQEQIDWVVKSYSEM